MLCDLGRSYNLSEPHLLRGSGTVSEPAGELICGWHFPSHLFRPPSLGRTLTSPTQPLPARATAPGMVAWHVAAPGTCHRPQSGPTAWGQTKQQIAGPTLPPPTAVGRSRPARGWRRGTLSLLLSPLSRRHRFPRGDQVWALSEVTEAMGSSTHPHPA